MRRLVWAFVWLAAACGGEVALEPPQLGDASSLDVHTPPPASDAGAPDVAFDAAVDVVVADSGLPAPIIAYLSDQPMVLTEDATFLYWTQGGVPGEVAKVSKDGGTPTILATKQIAPYGIAVDATSIYYVDSGYVTNSGVIMKMGLDGSSPTALASNQAEPVTLAVDASHVYWTNWGWQGASTIMRADLDGANATAIGTGTGVSWITLGAGYLWWAGNGGGGPGATVTRADLDGGNPTVMLTTKNGFNGIGVDSMNLYAADQQVLESVPVDGGAVSTLATYGPLMGGLPVVSDGSHVYWSVFAGLQSIDLDGGGATILAPSPVPASIVVDATYIYWLSNSPQAVSRLVKP